MNHPKPMFQLSRVRCSICGASGFVCSNLRSVETKGNADTHEAVQHPNEVEDHAHLFGFQGFRV